MPNPETGALILYDCDCDIDLQAPLLLSPKLFTNAREQVK